MLWWFLDHPALTPPARAVIEAGNTRIFVSAVSGIEITTKFRVGKLPQAQVLAGDLEQMVLEEGFEPLPVSMAHATLAGSLPIAHKDPFDRLLIAQAIVEGLTLVSNETVFEAAGAARLW